MEKTHLAAPNRFALYASGALLLLMAMGIRAASLLSNPGFESDPAGQNQSQPGWQAYGANTYNETGAAQAHGGTNYLKVYQAFTGSVNYNGIYQDYISGPGAAYAADGWAYVPAADVPAGQNQAWLEVSFRDATGNTLALYRSAIITATSISQGAFPTGSWKDLLITNQYDPGSYQITNTATKLVAPAGTYFVRYQVVFQGDASDSTGSVYFDDLNLAVAGGSPYGNYNIVWSDEFNGTNINANTWTYELGNGGWGNNELEYYTATNAFVTNGLLHIAASKSSVGGASYTSARMKSQGLFSCKYGRIEWRAQLPQGTGCWPALWMLGTNISSIGWPGCGEIDVVENNGVNPLMAQGSIHSGSDATAIYTFTDGNTVAGWHTYTLDWTTNAILFYVDGHLYETQTSWSSSAGSYPFPFNQPFFLVMNLAIGGNYVSNPTTNAINAGTAFPAAMLVDYVRIYTVTDPFRIGIKQAGQDLLLTWPTNIVCRVQGETNASLAGLNGNWSQISAATNQVKIVPTAGSGFFRLVSP